MEKCKNCRYFRAYESGEHHAIYTGSCYLRPPVVQTQQNVSLMPAAARPQVRDNDHCEEWKA